MQTPAMHTRQLDHREVAAFNALHSRNPYVKRLATRWPNKVAQYYVLSWTTENNLQRSEVHFCESEANWRASVFKDAGLKSGVEKRFGSAGETHVLLDGRQRNGCQCHNCMHAVGDLTPIEKPKQMSAARARKLARAG
ncbi:hypothetical protein [Flavobacterium sp.]|uniref:hypothetical protein n=1 Tax=Flavobacterium sp. TaxID=239 RepID=UPI002638F117|nr:hypothetical protein [Flavobacterium sp.]